MRIGGQLVLNRAPIATTNVVEATVPAPTSRPLAALRHRRFRLYSAGVLLSLIGNWVEAAAFGYVADIGAIALVAGFYAAACHGDDVAPSLTRGPYLQLATPESMVLAETLPVAPEPGRAGPERPV